MIDDIVNNPQTIDEKDSSSQSKYGKVRNISEHLQTLPVCREPDNTLRADLA